MPKDHIEVIARGALVVSGHILLCKSVKSLSKHNFLPGGHIDFAEQARVALVRELDEEAGLAVVAGPMLGVCESSFTQEGKHGKRVHHEINLVFLLSLPAKPRAKAARSAVAPRLPRIKSREDHIEFHWVPLAAFDPPSQSPSLCLSRSRGKRGGAFGANCF